MVDEHTELNDLRMRIAEIDEEIEKARTKRRIANNLIDDYLQEQDRLRKRIMKIQGKNSNFGFNIG